MKRLLVLSLCLGGFSPLASGDVKLALTFDKTIFSRGEPVTAWIVGENNGSKIAVFRIDPEKIEVINDHGETLPYGDAPADRVGGLVPEIVILRGQRRVEQFDIDAHYRMRQPGVYRITAIVEAYERTLADEVPWKRMDAVKYRGTVRSETKTITITDTADPALALMERCSGSWRGCISHHFLSRQGKPPLATLTSPSFVDPYIEIMTMQKTMHLPRDLRPWREAFMKRFPTFDQPGLLWMAMAQSVTKYNVPEVDLLLDDARKDPKVAHHPVVHAIEERKARLLESSAARP
jgi:hypothetical protein